jgi:hypothetical protein
VTVYLTKHTVTRHCSLSSTSKIGLTGFHAFLVRDIHGENAAFGVTAKQTGFASRQRNHIGALIVRSEGVSRHLAAVMRPGADFCISGNTLDLRRIGANVFGRTDKFCGYYAQQHQRKQKYRNFFHFLISFLKLLSLILW